MTVDMIDLVIDVFPLSPRLCQGSIRYNAPLTPRTSTLREESYIRMTIIIPAVTKGYHQSLPKNILVYRDGVSEGQYDKVVNEELPRLRKACTEVYPASDQKRGLPHFTIVIVGKRHHTRFYPTKETDADRSGNPKPSTIIDRGVTEAHNWDFFLQAHAAIQGTARPGHYIIVLDEIFRARYAKALPPEFNNVADVLEDLTQSLCYMYGRTTKAVSLCMPAYYADIVCERTRCYLSGVFDTPTQSAEPSSARSQTGGFKLGMKM
ncbi:uncharacterized protein NECHADRAFT_89387 [Fusarium vanettenii 77-13-4]|uniref:Piwi domain-containing protein n=1 Tax=Fusarium vanettenii (strain ATCC MYA-4622 / CBS 123669 / FGSC 9596 / NRRL 45880 / 77-13-4) TaxID=660122 RepID=C7ZR18_FUSV7|nr:uncharacterized protein NECHADRAFT_89387 [Fusarium vanettenii 77-13-4]EEU33537.1 hypothetical protein NECHADRAFT_89387 [Fusarium vanettenii 77-13-4]